MWRLPIDLVAILLGSLNAFCFLFTVFAFYLQRKRRRRLGNKELGFCPTFASPENALQKAKLFVQPQAKIITITQDTDEDPNDLPKMEQNICSGN
jgi:hypothetical protein